MVGELPAESIDADVAGHLPGAVHLVVAVVPREEDVAPVQEGQVARAPVFFVDHGAERGDGAVEAAAPPVLFVRALRRAIDRERHLVYPGMYQPPCLLVGERKSVRARVQVHLREM